jgi:hypothetical protein
MPDADAGSCLNPFVTCLHDFCQIRIGQRARRCITASAQNMNAHAKKSSIPIVSNQNLWYDRSMDDCKTVRRTYSYILYYKGFRRILQCGNLLFSVALEQILFFAQNTIFIFVHFVSFSEI